jgi:preprotein translocase subunit SecG
MQTVLIVIHLMIVLALVGVVLIQRSEGGGLGIGGGSGFMSARGAANALTRTTAILAALFFVTSLGLGLLARYQSKPSDILNQLPTTTQGDKSLLNSLGGKKPDEKKTEEKPANQNDIPLGGDATDTTKPVDNKIEVKPADTKTDVKPADTKTEVKPADATKTDVKPADSTTTAVKPADATATDKKPADASTTTTTDQKPATAK